MQCFLEGMLGTETVSQNTRELTAWPPPNYNKTSFYGSRVRAGFRLQMRPVYNSV